MPLRNSYNESLTYDKNGNILSLHRNGGLDSPTTVIEIDDLAYTYDTSKKNQLVKVVDDSNSTQGFTNGASGTNNDYTYDSYGNLKTDLNKGITGIKYNHLNLPVEVKFDNSETKKINYIYNAAGVKLRKEVNDNGTITTTDYLNGFQYLNTVQEFFSTAEGYVKNTVVGSANNYNYVYHYKDHLGNVRVSYTVDPADSVLKILEENHYYPFGLKHESYSATQQMIKGTPGGEITVVPVTGPDDLTY